MPLFADSSWRDVEMLRSRVMELGCPTVAEAAQLFVTDLATTFPSVVLARTFVVTSLDRLPADEREWATRAANGDPSLREGTRVLSLLGTFGREAAWCDRTTSKGHLAVPLVSRAAVDEIPMIASLLADLQVDLGGLDMGASIATRRMLGGLNGKFVVSDARTVTDARDRWVIAGREFVAKYGVKTVFGMGGSYVDGTVAVTIVFTDELIPTLVVDRFPSLISNFKMATSTQLRNGRIYV